MSDLLDKLKHYGADIDGAMGRFLDDTELYRTCFIVFLQDEAFSGLESALAAKEYEKAFEFAHTLKGVSGNMGLTPLYQVICSLVEQLRSKVYSDLDTYSEKIRAQLALLRGIGL